jgi:ribokinase
MPLQTAPNSNSPVITVFGSVNVDLTFRLPHLPAVGETVLTATFTQAVGGKGANQAIAAARDGARVRFIGCVGADSYGTTARNALAGLDIDVSSLKIVPGTTGLAAVWIDSEGRNQIAVASGANEALNADALLTQTIAAETFVVLQMETPVSEVEAAVGYAKQRNARIVLNLAPALPLAHATLRQADVLVLNEHEAAVLSQHLRMRHAEPADQVVTLARDLRNTVIITLGAEGAIGARGDETWRVEALPVMAIDTTGAGDCFVGVLASALSGGAAIPTAMRRAAVAGSLACEIVGAMPSFPTRASIDAALVGTEHPQGKVRGFPP